MSDTTDIMTCHQGGSKGSLTGITIDDSKGIMLAQTAKLLSGALMALNPMYMENIRGNITGKVSELASLMSSPTADPMAANNAEYAKYPAKK